jgi:hypothetical protein
MMKKVTAAIACDGSGNATVYLGSRLRGRVHAIQYVKGTLDAGTDLVITGETTEVAIMTDSPAASEWFYPRAFPNQATDGAAEADAILDIHVLDERIKVVVAQGGASGAGSISAFVETAE